MSEATSQRLSRIPYAIRWRPQHLRLGQHRSRLRGAGLEFNQLQESPYGEGVRTINWAATARRGGTPLLVNTYYEDKDITVMLLVDLSASMDFGSVRLSKKMLAAEISASLVYSALLSHDRIGLLSFTSKLETYLPPRRVRWYQQAIPEAIRHDTYDRTQADWVTATAILQERLKQPALIFLLSDFLTDDVPHLSQALVRLQARHDVIALVVTDPREEEFPAGSARMAIRDLETGQIAMYDFSANNRHIMTLAAQTRQHQLQQTLQHVGIASVSVTPCSDYVQDITRLFLGRCRRTKG
jgi:uncharacterized protein (DUF58 family)